MAKKPTSSVTVTFVSPVDTITDKVAVRAAYKDLCKQITSLAESIAADPNVIISHSKLVGPSTSSTEVEPVDTKLAELQTINKKVATGKSVAVNPEHKSEFEPQIEETDDEERPRVRACEWVKPEPTVPIEKKPTHWVPPQTNVAEAEAKATDTTLKGKLEVTIFSNLKKTEKSSKIVEYFLSNINKEVSIDDIASGTKLDKSAVNSWLAQTSKEIKAIQKCEKRGHYIFDSSKVKVY